jgi:hypothetical protein
MNPIRLILQSLDLIIEDKLWPDKKPSEIFNILMFVHQKGWLYTPTVDGKITAVMCGYRIPDVTDENLVKLPLKEEGSILYIPFVISMDKSENLFHIVRASCSIYLEQHPEVTELVLEDKNNKIKRYSLK